MKNLIKIIICFSFIYTPFFAYAGAAEKWEILEKTFDKPKSIIEVTARKVGQDAANSPVHKAKTTVNPSTLGKAARGGVFGVATYAALAGILGGLGWIMDSSTQSIYKNKVDPNADPSFPTDDKMYYVPRITDVNGNHLGNYTVRNVGQIPAEYRSFSGTVLDKSGTKLIVLSAAIVVISGKYYLRTTTEMENADRSRYNKWTADTPISSAPNTLPQPKPAPEPQKEILTDDELGNIVLDNAPEIVPDLYTDPAIPNNPAYDQVSTALDSANPEPSEQPEGTTKTEPELDPEGNPTGKETGSFELPVFCSWAPAVCDFFKVQKQDNKEIKENQKEDIEQNKTFFDEVNDFFDWTKEDNDLPKNEDAEISQIPLPELKEDAVRWSGQCPNDAQIPINLYGQSTTLTLSWSPWCQLLSIIKPAIIASAYIGGAFIVLGLRT